MNSQEALKELKSIHDRLSEFVIHSLDLSDSRIILENLIESMFLGEVVDDKWHLPDDTSHDENRKEIENDASEPQAPVSA